MNLYIWNLDADGVKNRIIVFAHDEQEAVETAWDEYGIKLDIVDRPKPEVYEKRAVFLEYTGIHTQRERVPEIYRDCVACGCVIQKEGGETEDGLLCAGCAKNISSYRK